MSGANAFKPTFRSYQNVAQVQAPDLTTVLDSVLNNAITRENTQANIDKLKYDLEFAKQIDPIRLKGAAAELDKLLMENGLYKDKTTAELGLTNAQAKFYNEKTNLLGRELDLDAARIAAQRASNDFAINQVSYERKQADLLNNAILELNKSDNTVDIFFANPENIKKYGNIASLLYSYESQKALSKIGGKNGNSHNNSSSSTSSAMGSNINNDKPSRLTVFSSSKNK